MAALRLDAGVEQPRRKRGAEPGLADGLGELSPMDLAEQREVLLEDEEREFVGGGRGEERAHQRQHILPDTGVSALDDGSGEADLHGQGGRYAGVGVGLVGL